MQLDQRVPMGTVIKCLAVYDEPFWRDTGLSGMATSEHRAGQAHLRQLAPGRQPRRPARLHRGPGRPRLGSPRSPRSARRPSSDRSCATSAPGARPADRLHREVLGRRPLEPRLLRRLHASGRADRLPGRDPRAGRADALGRHRDGDRVGRLHGAARSSPGCAPPPRCSPSSEPTSEGPVSIGTKIGEIGYGSGPQA